MNRGLSGLYKTSRSLFSTQTRIFQQKMAIEWNVVIYDKPGSDRSAVRAQHLADIPPNVNKGIITSAGPLFHDVERTKFAGSAFHLVADSKEDIIEFLKKDIFYKEGIWDIDSVVIHPFLAVTRLPQKLDGVTVGND